MKYLPDEEIARRAYESWRAAVNTPLLMAWESLPDLNREAWIARVSMYHERPWGPMDKECDRDRCVREACTKAGR